MDDVLLDDGPLAAAVDPRLSGRFRLWRGKDGQRHVYSVYHLDDAPDYPAAVALAVRRMEDRRVVVWAGPAGAGARRAAERAGADEIHLRILPDAESGPLAPADGSEWH
ncbi:hypothetical protein [Ancylobacter terrae]|uniref:hypothetical protein n=1 Tax=Ancylobacter sp. sgz301288 TaxID=3342077 RepID=UPI00385B9D94